MARFRVVRRSSLPAAEAWRRLTDWPRHGDHVPLTRVTAAPPGPTRPGTLVVARTGLGRLGFDDPMEVVRWEPPTDRAPGRCRLEKRGRVVTGWAEIEVRALDNRSEVAWHEEVQLGRAGRLSPLLDPPTAWSARLVFGRLLGALLDDQGRTQGYDQGGG
ncbi:SRPBCC family protein [Streptomyces sp. B6B3]|uniref:SRPBCC family protein n=1 Tax=Streptomyces sp. B6B3 TaxID=3153570 RepID=UPI00325E9F64